ncbi:MAG TPA: glycosyltransferase, partial [Bacteroidota bacterium]|nr:glycosyltransferase [Bacteroidota bacterium]
MTPRVLFIDEDQAHNGSTVSLEYLLDGFKSGGYDVDVLTWKTDPKFKIRMQQSARVIDARSRLVRAITLHVHFAYVQSPFSVKGIRMILNDIVKMPAGILVVMRAIRRLKPDIVYANEYSVLQASIAAALCGVPAVMQIRSPLIRGKWGIRRRLMLRGVLAFNDAIFAISRLEREQFHPRGREKEKLRVIGEFVDAPSAGADDQARCREKFGIPPGRPVVAMLGGIMDIKGTLDFLRAAMAL